MKLVLFMLTVVLVNVSATTYAQTTRISLEMTNSTVKEVLKEIERKSDLTFFYSDDAINTTRRVNVKASNKPINEILSEILPDCAYKVDNKKIILTQKPAPIVQQQRKITGTVVDPNNEALIGANVSVKGTTNGTMTDEDGNFSLEVPQNATLLVSYVGYETKEIAIGAENNIKITLLENNRALTEVVVTALGIKREEKSLGYAIDKIDGSKILAGGQTNMALGLAGKIPGVQIAASSSGMDGTPRVVIRGISSLSNDNSPLWVVNGIPQQTNRVLNESLWAPSGFNDWGNPLSDINPNDIEEVSVLKGAAATALYGSRASNGAILVTTKKGAVDQKGWKMSLSHTTTFSRPLILPKYQTMYGMGTGGEYEYVDGKGNGIGEFSNSFGPSFIDPATGNYRKIAQFDSPIDPVTGKRIPTDWMPYGDNFKNFYETGLDVNTTVAASYVNELTNTRISLSHNKVNDIVPNSELTRIGGSVNSEIKLGNRLKVDVMMLMSQMDSPSRSGQGGGSTTEGMMWFPNSIDIRQFKNNYKDEFGEPRTWKDDGTPNPYWSVYENLNPSTRNKFTGKIGFTFEVLKGLNLQANLYNDYNSTDYEQITAKWKKNDGRYSVGNNMNKEYNADLSVNFNKQVGDFSLVASLGTAIRNEQARYRTAVTEGGLLRPGVYNLANSKQEAKTTYQYVEKEVQSVISYVDIGYKNFLYLTVTGRNDWSSTLPSTDWSYFYPSVSGSFIFTELMKNKNSILSFGKVRVNWAKVGNDTGAYQLGRYVNRSIDWTSTEGKQAVMAFENVLPPIGLKPEQKTSWEIGADLRFLNNRIGLDIAYFNDKARNQIIKTEIPWEAGGRHRMVNAGLLKTRGVEIKVDANIINTKDFSWDVAANWSTNKTKVVELYPGVDFLHISAFNGIEVRAIPGENYGSIWGFVNINDSQEFWDKYGDNPMVQNLTNGMKTPYNTGKDFTKDGNPINTVWQDLLPLNKNTTPDWMAGITNTFRYKGFDLNFTIDVRHGGYIASSSIMSFIQSGKDASTVAFNSNGVNIREPIKNGGGLIYDGTDIDTGKPNTIPINAESYYDAWNTPTTKILYKADYIKLRDLTIGYRVPKKFLSSLGIGLTSARLAFVGRNLWLIQNNLPGFDPETSTMGSGNSGAGVEYYSLPSTRNLGFNIQVEF
ncbi:SusC/RagA family TonB-linked outer membrane protein [Prevotella sp. 10(H)]|uniref:SusC/RagA family TonB-linked outer membrane protein n=1 Tax=Prevotella sp. 10(H) TaxID=1158294 RepID=UPI000A5B011D|nr:SusC/RagA family TonB-linked outer membrane protein [Prevotella sp. 10(H)]